MTARKLVLSWVTCAFTASALALVLSALTSLANCAGSPEEERPATTTVVKGVTLTELEPPVGITLYCFSSSSCATITNGAVKPAGKVQLSLPSLSVVPEQVDGVPLASVTVTVAPTIARPLAAVIDRVTGVPLPPPSPGLLSPLSTSLLSFDSSLAPPPPPPQATSTARLRPPTRSAIFFIPVPCN